MPNICCVEGNVEQTYTTDEVLESLRERVRYPVTQSEIADELGFSGAFISGVLAGKDAMSERLGNALGFEKQPETWTRKQEDYRIGALGRTRRNHAMWEEEHADYLLEQERDDRMRQMECNDE
jgi:plasmid maintenance system antidote protein VapI